MALRDTVLDELGLAPLWVRRGTAQAAQGAQGAQDPAAPVANRQAQHDGARVADAPRVPHVPHALPVPRESANARGDAHVAPAREDAQPEQGAAAVAQSAQSVVQSAPRADAVAPRADARGEPAADPHAYARASSPPTIEADAARAPTPDAHREHGPDTAARPPESAAPLPDDDFGWPEDAPLAGLPASDESALPGVQTLDWDALSARVAACTRCRLCEKRTQTVFGVGDRNADWMLIGEAPGENEDRLGEPFVGQAGKLLDNMLRALALARGENVYIANVIKCRPPGNRNPEPDEVARCEPYLQRQVALVKPKLILALGRFAAQSVLKTDASISSLRGRVHAYEGVPVIVTYHPAYLLRSLNDKSKAWADLCLARDTWLKAGGVPAGG